MISMTMHLAGKATALSLGLLKRASWMLSGAFALEFDLETNQASRLKI